MPSEANMYHSTWINVRFAPIELNKSLNINIISLTIFIVLIDRDLSFQRE
jgi:hypothetical protein